MPEYPRNKLEYTGIKVNSFDLQTTRGTRIPPNNLLTFWKKSQIDLSTGLDFGENEGKLLVSYTHLQHAVFSYKINVTNSTGAEKMGTCRIYCVPKDKERGVEMNFEEQRNLMIEMDKFTVTCKFSGHIYVKKIIEKLILVTVKAGQNTIERRSTQSSVTLPYERFFGELTYKEDGKPDDFCTCGWPQHLLVPKGTTNGADFKFIVQISNFDDDVVDGPIIT